MPDFIDSCDMDDAGLPEHPLEVQHRVQALALPGLFLEAPGQSLIEFPGAGTRIPL